MHQKVVVPQSGDLGVCRLLNGCEFANDVVAAYFNGTITAVVSRIPRIATRNANDYIRANDVVVADGNRTKDDRVGQDLIANAHQYAFANNTGGMYVVARMHGRKNKAGREKVEGELSVERFEGVEEVKGVSTIK